MSSSIYASLNKYKIVGLPDAAEEEGRLTYKNFYQKGCIRFTLLEADPMKGRPPKKFTATMFGEVGKQLDILQIRNGSVVNVCGMIDSYEHNGHMFLSATVFNLSLDEIPEENSRKERRTIDLESLEDDVA